METCDQIIIRNQQILAKALLFLVKSTDVRFCANGRLAVIEDLEKML